MKTDALIAMLATGSSQEVRNVPASRLSLALCLAAPAATLLMLALMDLNPALGAALAEPRFWLKLAYVIALAATAMPLVARLSRPGARVAPLLWALALAVGLMVIAATGSLLLAESGMRSHLVFGDTWKVCAPLITLLAAPIMLATLLAMRELAPTRLKSAGAAAGLLSGAVGALIYSAHCPELAPPFVVIWYSAGIAIPSAVGALLGPRVLRW